MTPTPSPRTAAERLMATLRSEPDLGVDLSTYADLVDAIEAQPAPPDALRACPVAAALDVEARWLIGRALGYITHEQDAEWVRRAIAAYSEEGA